VDLEEAIVVHDKVLDTKIALIGDEIGSYPTVLDHRFGAPNIWEYVSAIGDVVQSIRQRIPAVGWSQRIEMVVTGAASSVDLDGVKATMSERHTEAGHMFVDSFSLIASLTQSASRQSTSVFGLGQQAPPVPSPLPSIAPLGPSSDTLLSQVNALSERLHQLETYADATSVKISQVG
jgi:hypothetical protein